MPSMGVHQTADLDEALAVARSHLLKGETVLIRRVEFYSPGAGYAVCEHEAQEYQVEVGT